MKMKNPKNKKDKFKHILKHSEKVAKRFWNNKEDEVWDKI